MYTYFVGLDLGCLNDYSAVNALERVAPTVEVEDPRHPWKTIKKALPVEYRSHYLHRYPLGTTYPAIVEAIGQLLNRHPFRGKSLLVIDSTGVGLPICQMFDAADIPNAKVIITGGHTENRENGVYHVPKRLLVSTLQVLLQSERLKIASSLKEARTLTDELANFQITVTEAANEIYGGRAGKHDDLVLATALPLHHAENHNYGTYQVRWDGFGK